LNWRCLRSAFLARHAFGERVSNDQKTHQNGDKYSDARERARVDRKIQVKKRRLFRALYGFPPMAGVRKFRAVRSFARHVTLQGQCGLCRGRGRPERAAFCPSRATLTSELFGTRTERNGINPVVRCVRLLGMRVAFPGRRAIGNRQGLSSALQESGEGMPPTAVAHIVH